MTPSGPRLSVVICTKDRPGELATCLGSLAAQSLLPAEVLVVDASAEAPDAVVEDFHRRVSSTTSVRLIRASPGLPRQRNIGIHAASGDVVVFFDDDVVLEPDYLREISAVYERDTARAIGGVGGAQVPDPTPRESATRRAYSRFFLLPTYGRGRLKRSGFPEYAFCPDAECEVDFLSGCNMSFRREVFGRLGFDERLTGYAIGEDLQLSYRVSREWKLMLTPRARVDHRHVGGGRPGAGRLEEMRVLNRYLFMRDVVARRRLDWAAFAWSEVGTLLRTLRHPGNGRLAGRMRGHRQALAAVLRGRPLSIESAAASGPTASGKRPTISVVVPARNEERTLGRCLESILAQTYPAARVSVIVVENGSTDRTAEVAGEIAARDSRVRVLRADATNQAEAMNEGILAASGDVVARVDAHSHVAPEYLERVLDALGRHPDAVGVGGPFLPAGETLRERAAGLARSSPYGVGGGYGADRREADHAVRSVQCGAYWRTALLDVGLFDPAMAYGEDEEINWRLLEGDGRIYLCRDLAQFYRPRATFTALARQYWNYGQGRLRVLLKHRDFLLPRHLVPSLFVLGLVALASATVLTPAARPALVMLGAAWIAALGAAGARAARTDWRAALLVPVAVGCVHVGYGAGMLWGLARHARGRLVVAPQAKEGRQWPYVMEQSPR